MSRLSTGADVHNTSYSPVVHIISFVINGWCDKNGEVFIFYTVAETSEMLDCGHDKATRLQRELEEHNLLRRKYQGKGKPAKLYVLTAPKISTEPP